MARGMPEDALFTCNYDVLVTTDLTDQGDAREYDCHEARRGYMERKSRRAALGQLAALSAAGTAGTLICTRRSTSATPVAPEDRERYVDCRDFAGLDPTGFHPSDAQINSAIAAGVANHLPVYLCGGTYSIANPLIGNPLAVKHGYANLRFFGAGGLGSLDPKGFSSRAHTVIAPNFKDRPALALDLMSGAVLKDFSIQGLNTAPNSLVMPMDDQGDYVTHGCRNNRYSPYCAIAIDAFNSVDITAENRYPGMSQQYFSQGGGSAGLTLENLWIANFVVGIAYGISGLAANTEDILFENVWISRVDTCYAVGHSQARHCMMQMGNLGFARQGIDGFNYGSSTGCPPKFHRVNHGFLYRIFTMPNTVGNFLLDDNYAESIRTLGNFGLGSGYSRQPLSFIGGDYTITSNDLFSAPPPLILETYSPTVFKAVSLTRDANSTSIDALNVIAGDTVCSFEQCYLPGTGTAHVPPFIGLVLDASHVQCRVTDCYVASANGSEMYLSDDSPRSHSVAPFAPDGRYSATYQSRRVTDGKVEYVYQPHATGSIQSAVAAANLNLSTVGRGRFEFNTSQSHLQAGDVLFWQMKRQGTSLNQWVVPALKVKSVERTLVVSDLMFDPSQYDSVAKWNVYYSGTMFIAVRQWAPAQELTCSMNDSITITAVSPPTILIGNGPGVAGDWIVGAGIPPNTRVVSVNRATATATLSQPTTGGPANKVKLYFGRLYSPTLTAAF